MVQITNDGRPKSELVTDGVRVFYAAPLRMNLTQWHTYQVPVAGGEPSRFSDEEWSPVAISPDSAQLLLTRSSTRQTNLGYTGPDRFWSRSLGGAPPRIIPIEAHDAAWSADGTQIVYAVHHEIALAAADGALVRKLAALPGIASGLEWSPRRDLIRFTLSLRAGLEGRRDLGDPRRRWPTATRVARVGEVATREWPVDSQR